MSPRRAPPLLAVALAVGLSVAGPSLAAPPTARDALAQPTPVGHAAQAPAYAVEAPAARTLYRSGPDGRYLLGGAWLFRFATAAGSLQSSSSVEGWRTVTAPNAWNATDESLASYVGTVGWYRKDFKLPTADSGLTWIVRFESVNYRASVWLNGRLLGHHAGAYLPFEFALPRRLLAPTGTNRLVIRVDNRRTRTDLPPAGVSANGAQEGGWWNYGGLLREVYLRSVRKIDFESVQVLPQLRCPGCPARIDYRVTLHNYSASPQRVSLTSRFGGLNLLVASHTIPAGRSAVFVRHLPVARPQLWWPGRPYLYDVTLDTSAAPPRGGAFMHVGHYYLQSGIRSVRVVGGHLLLNGRQLNFRGVGLHEDSPDAGAAIDSVTRRRFITETKDLGATLIRAHYPLHPQLEELADQNGVLLWSEVPVYQVKVAALDRIRRRAVDLVRTNVLTNSNHPSVIAWSIGNELAGRAGAGQAAYIRAATTAIRSLDPTRPVGLAVAGYPSIGCQRAYAPLDIVGVNDYFGWYIGPSGSIADAALLSTFLDQQRACYRRKALVVTEFGAEADRHGPVEERGTYEFQQQFIRSHLQVYSTKPYLSGAIYWALEEFRVRPGWVGGNPHPHPPLHEKGVITFGGLGTKPAYADMQLAFQSTRQLR